MIEYQEWIKRDGTVLILCDFNKLLMDYYGYNTMTQVQSQLRSNGEYVIQCPFCKSEGYVKEKLYIKGDLTVGHCFKCHRAYLNVTDTIEYKIRKPNLKFRSNNFDLVKLNDKNWTLDMYYNEFDDFDEIGYKYLMSRHEFMDPLYKILGFKFHNHHVVMPFYFHGELIYYQIRFTNKNPIRYYFPPISHKPIYAIENGCRDLIICEGVMDAVALFMMYPDRMPVAVLGSSVSDYQIEMIRTYCPTSILVYMDESDLSYKVRSKLRSVIDNIEIKVRRSDGEDPEECFKRYIRYGKYDETYKQISKFYNL